MSSESKPGPASENSRRDFFQKIGTLAAASSVAARVGAAQQPPPGGQVVVVRLDHLRVGLIRQHAELQRLVGGGLPGIE